MSSWVGIGKLVDGDGKYVLWHFTGVRGYSVGLGSRVIAGVLMDFFEGRLWVLVPDVNPSQREQILRVFLV
jgi:hypothetical protein